MTPINLKAHELKLADIVELFDDGYGTATVVQITESEIHFFRPYVHTADFSYTGGVIHTIGFEYCKYSLNSNRVFKVFQRTELK